MEVFPAHRFVMTMPVWKRRRTGFLKKRRRQSGFPNGRTGLANRKKDYIPVEIRILFHCSPNEKRLIRRTRPTIPSLRKGRKPVPPAFFRTQRSKR